MNKIEAIKAEKDGLDVLNDIPAFVRDGWESIDAGDRERLKWAGVFFRRQTPGAFMMRLRMPNGKSDSAQIRAIADVGDDYGKGFVDITTRQQIQLRWFRIEDVPDIWRRLEAVGLVSIQTGMDNIRNVVGCPLAGLSRSELFDGSPAAERFTEMFLRDSAYTNLPRKFNVAITGCRENCVHGDTQDISLTPALKSVGGAEVAGFNAAVGGKMGSGGFTPAKPLDVFVPPEDAAALCSHIALAFRDNGLRKARNKSRLAFLIADWGIERFRAEIERRAGGELARAGRDARTDARTDHVGIIPQRQDGLNAVGLVVPSGRVHTRSLRGVADLADEYGDGGVRITVAQNLIVPNVPDERLESLLSQPLLNELSPNPSEIVRGTVSCTGIDYCHFSQIETKELAMRTARTLEARLGKNMPPTSVHWSGCVNGCANHTRSDIGLLGRRVKANGRIEDAVDVFARPAPGEERDAAIPVLRGVLISDLPDVLEKTLRERRAGLDSARAESG